jgi:hypothetical protein
MGLAADDEDEIALGHLNYRSILERDAGCTPAEIMKNGIRRSRQRHGPGATELVVEEHGPFQTNAIEHVGENVHACYVTWRTIGHKIWTIAI